MRKKFVMNQARIIFVVLGLLIMYSLKSAAHEVTPNIADISIDGKSITVELCLNVEAFLARIDLSAIENIDEAEQTSDYQSLRQLRPDNLTRLFEHKWQDFSNQVNLQSSSLVKLNALEFLTLSIPDIEDPELPRLSRVSFRTDRPDQDGVTFTLSHKFGSQYYDRRE